MFPRCVSITATDVFDVSPASRSKYIMGPPVLGRASHLLVEPGIKMPFSFLTHLSRVTCRHIPRASRNRLRGLGFTLWRVARLHPLCPRDAFSTFRKQLAASLMRMILRADPTTVAIERGAGNDSPAKRSHAFSARRVRVACVRIERLEFGRGDSGIATHRYSSVAVVRVRRQRGQSFAITTRSMWPSRGKLR